MTTRFIVIQPAPATAAEEIADELAEALAARGDMRRISAMDGVSVEDLSRDPAAALDGLSRRIRELEAGAVLIDQVEELPVSTFDVLGWNLDVAASTGARVLLALDAEGIPPELVAQDILVAGARAAAHGTAITAALVRGAALSRIDAGGVPVLACPPAPAELSPLLS
ncbi:MAG: hypothetical protein LKI58_01310 [Actinomyces sp.]|nr:hypothetical protein [Actinomyces sp.]MCI1641667.1 hypothetical protein [Actinomyces sp.]MCI1661860.1 hypothetical protein [Actinomyces sp.]MCI1690702.1 hypothetical protein [Actinomyces sp.]MCI1786696.1 hypothetical protein [Actinomyces sp.]MCI1829160.1 hypothetical protein [Actinomyces sp.]